MRADDLRHVTAGSPFFESGQASHDERPLVDLAPLIDPSWSLARGGWWTTATPRGTHLPDVGWKVHVSPDVDHLVEELRTGIAVLVGERVAFKVLSSASVERRSRAKLAVRTQVGKVLVAYPHSDEALIAVCRRLTGVLRHPGGPVVVGETRIGGGPVYLRHGAITGAWLAAHGEVRPAMMAPQLGLDRRGTPVAGTHPVLDLLASGRDPRPALVLGLEDPEVLHRTGGGSVYAGRIDGAEVVVKEARRFAGLDAGSIDAEQRLRHEARVLERLAGSGAAPELIEVLDDRDSVLLVMRRMPGTPLHRCFATRHPPVFASEATIEADADAYRLWAGRVRASLDARLAALHERGVAHGDVSPQNALVEGGVVHLIDFESASLDGLQVARGVTTAGFGSLVASPHADRCAAAAIGSLLVNPLAPALSLHRNAVNDLPGALAEAGHADLRRSFRSDPGPELLPEEEITSMLLAGIRRAATLSHEDRLFPGGVGMFRDPVAPLAIAHGAAGVISALLAVGERPRDSWLDAVEERSLRVPVIPGAGVGLHGVARLLAEVGRLDTARRLVERLPERPTGDDATWGTGDSGRAVCLLRIAELTGDEEILRLGLAHVDAAVRARPTARTGLVAGQAGIALALAGCADVIRAVSAGAPGVVEHAANAALDAEPVRTDPRTGFRLSPTGRGLLPSLGAGVAARVLALHQLDRPRDDGALAALRSPVIGTAGLFEGRAGVLLGLSAWLPPDDPSVLLHRRRIAWHLVTADEDADAAFVLGDANLKASCDVATGSAGVLLALAGPSAVGRALGIRFPR